MSVPLAPQTSPFRLGAGAGFAGDRLEPAIELAKYGELDALVFECLAERTIALAQTRRNGGGPGYDQRILERFATTLPHLLPAGGVAITNAGAADPVGAADAARAQLDEVGVKSIVAAVTGDDVLDKLDFANTQILGSDSSLAEIQDRIISANAYAGAGGIVEALSAGANVIITGRVGDASLFTAPLLHHFQQPIAPTGFLAEATLVGHLLECAGQLTGGYFADGVDKIVPGLARLGFPFAEVQSSGQACFQKIPETGGEVSVRTAREQLYYEIDNPAKYLTPDLAVDISHVALEQLDHDIVRAHGSRPLFTPETLKVSVGVRDGYAAAAEITYAGLHALDRAKLAAEILRERWRDVYGNVEPLEFHYIGYNSTRPWWQPQIEPAEVRLRTTLRTIHQEATRSLCREVEALYTNGPAAGGGVSFDVRPTTGIVSVLIARNVVEQKVQLL